MNSRGRARARGYTLIELLVGLVTGAIALAGAYSLWQTHSRESYKLEKKIELRNKLTLCSKRIQRSVTLAGFGLKGVSSVIKRNGGGSDTLVLFTNASEAGSALAMDASKSISMVQVANPSLFAPGSYVALSNGASGEIREIDSISGPRLFLDSVLTADYPMGGSAAFPAVRERYYTDQDSSQLIHEQDGNASSLAGDIRDFAIIFRDKHGSESYAAGAVRTVQFSYDGIFPSSGALNKIAYSSTAIPRNAL